MKTLQKLIIDADTASGDAAAIVFALRETQLQVLAVTTVAGAVPLARACRNSALAMERAGAVAVPLYAGCARPLVRPAPAQPGPWGPDGLSGAHFSEPRLAPEPEHAVNALIHILRAEQEVTILALGPMTNLALALRKAPDIAGHISRVAAVAGCGLSRAAHTAAAEFNVFTDPHAADIVFSSGIPLLLFPAETGLADARLPGAELAALRGCGDPAAELCLRGGAWQEGYHRARYGEAFFALPEAAAAACLIHPEWIRDSLCCKVRADVSGACTLGQTILDGKAPEEERTALVATGLDRQALAACFYKTLGGEGKR